MVRKIYIYTLEEVKLLPPKLKLPTNEDAKLGKLDAEAVVNPDD